MTEIIAVGAICIRDGKILIVRDEKSGWLFPGGKLEKGESDLEGLKREVLEEIGCRVDVGKFFGTFFDESRKHGRKVEVRMYFCELIGEVKEGAEILEFSWTDFPEDYDLTGAAREIIEKLRENGVL